MFDDVEVLTYEEYQDDVYQAKHGLDYGSSTLVLTKGLMKALRKGLVIACNDGEYCTFVMLEMGGKE